MEAVVELELEPELELEVTEAVVVRVNAQAWEVLRIQQVS